MLWRPLNRTRTPKTMRHQYVTTSRMPQWSRMTVFLLRVLLLQQTFRLNHYQCCDCSYLEAWYSIGCQSNECFHDDTNKNVYYTLCIQGMILHIRCFSQWCIQNWTISEFSKSRNPWKMDNSQSVLKNCQNSQKIQGILRFLGEFSNLQWENPIKIGIVLSSRDISNLHSKIYPKNLWTFQFLGALPNTKVWNVLSFGGNLGENSDFQGHLQI